LSPRFCTLVAPLALKNWAICLETCLVGATISVTSSAVNHFPIFNVMVDI
jgi:hypothetical protein